LFENEPFSYRIIFCIINFYIQKGWQEVDRDAAREKVSHFFRFNRSKTPAPASEATSGEQKTSGEFGEPADQSLPKRVTPYASPFLGAESQEAAERLPKKQQRSEVD
jgi:hypothetical protein